MTEPKLPAEPTPRCDANEVDLNECISVETLASGLRRYVDRYVPAYISRQLERELTAANARAEAVEKALRLWKIATDNAEECEFDDCAHYAIPMPLFCDAEEATDAAIDAMVKP